MNSLNPYRDEFLGVTLSFAGRDFTRGVAQITNRYDLCKRFAWAIPDDQFAQEVRKFTDLPLLEVGSGTGYWGHFLNQFDIPVTCTDIAPYKNHYSEGQWFPVEELDVVAAVKRYPDHALFMVWPEYNSPMAADALAAYTGAYLIYVGETEGGCTGDQRFFDLLSEGWDLVTEQSPLYEYMGIHTYHHFYARKDDDVLGLLELAESVADGLEAGDIVLGDDTGEEEG